MGKIFRISLIILAIGLSFSSLSFGDPVAKGTSPANSSNGLNYGPWIAQKQREVPFSWPEKAESGSTFYGAKPSKAVRHLECSMNPEITNPIQSPVTIEIQRKESSLFENSQLSIGNSSYHFGKINLIKTDLETSLNFISRLSTADDKEENPLSWTLEKIKDTDIFKSLTIVLKLKLTF